MIVSFDELVEILKGKVDKIVLCHGVFDLLHIGHIKHLQSAKKKGTLLVVTVTPDKYVNKGIGRPIFTENNRVKALDALSCVDLVAINKWDTAVETIKIIKPDVFVKDVEYLRNGDKGFKRELKALEEIGGQIGYTKEDKFSSSNILNKFQYSPDILNLIKGIKKNFSYEDIKSYIDKIKDMKILVIGDIVIDEYHFGTYMGKMRRETIMEFSVENKERYLGGSGIIANHLSSFCDNISLLSVVGDDMEEFITEKLSDNVNTILYKKENTNTNLKRRYVEEKLNYRNLFKVSEIQDEPIDVKLTNKICRYLNKNLEKFDMVIVADYGHGFIDGEIIDSLEFQSTFLAVNTQINTENMGFNTIDRYETPNFICINEDEVRLICKEKHENISVVVNKFAKKMSLDKFIITRGPYGCICHDKKTKEIPVISNTSVDTMGAGDALFAITSPLVYQGVPMEIVAFIGNVSGYLHSQVVGNKDCMDKEKLCQLIKTLMK